MAIRHKKGLKGSIDDVLSDLLGDDDDTPKFPIKSNKPASFGSSGGRPRGVASEVNKKDPLDDDFFSKMAHEKETEAEDPDISDVDPEALLETLKDMDDMEADLLGIKKTNSQKPVKDVEKSQHLSQPTKSGKKAAADEKGDSISGMDKKTSSAPATSKQLMQKLSFEDVDDPLAGLLSDEEDDMVKKVYSSATKSTPETNAGMSKEKGTSLPSTPGQATQRKREELVFEGDGNDLMDALGFGDSSRTELKAGRKGDVGEPRPARSMLDELLGRGTDTKRLERQNTGEAKEFKLDKKYKKQADKEDNWGDEFTFGAYQPTVALAPEGQQSRRQSVRFSSENLSELKTDQRSKPSTSVSASPIRSKGGADWLGLKDEDFDSPPSPPPKAFSKGGVRGTAVGISSSPSDDEHPLPTRSKPSAEEGTQKPEPVKDDSDSWLSHVLSQKKSQAQEKVEEKREKRAEPSDPVRFREEVASVPVSSHPATSTQKQQQSGVLTNRVPTLEESGPSMTLLNVQEQAAPVVLSSATKRTPFADIVKAAPAASLQGVQEGLQVPTLTQLLHSEPLVLSSTTSGENEKKMASMQAQFQESVASYQSELLSAQTRLVELEGQVRRLELEKNQQKLLLESLQQRYQDDLELIENAHRNRVKVVEDSYRQREERLRQENQELAEQCLSQCQSAEQAKSELLAQHQRRITEMEQEKVKEIDRLQELQRVSILQMHKDHEEQLQRLKRLKDQEIDAVTTATSYTRSLNGIIEQMEQFSSNLNDLSNKVEATHHTTSEGLEIGVRQREQQHKVLQDRLARQQRDMEEERNRLQEVISKMEARLNEQTRLLEQERWRATAEQSKVAALQHSLEEQRRVLTQQLAMEREELERAKNALLEEQKSVMQKCAAERHRLAVEWSEFHTQQRLSKERTEREVDRALQIDTQREGAIMSLAKEQADLKIKASELRSKEEQLAREREILEQEKQQLRLEKEKVNAAALHIKQRADEIDSMSKLSSQRYEEGEQALLEARKVESEHQTRLLAVQRQMEQLRQQEEHLHQERLSLSHQRRQLEQLRDSLSSNPLLFQTTPQMPLPGTQAKIISNVQYLPVPATDLPKVDLGNFGASQDLPVTGPVDLYAKLVLHKLTADRDNDFLEEERFFLETLKKASYKTSSQIA
ncbi:fas-binding factor 1 isoform X1 [Sphaerodactylus townsendi]|uniref:fas-binding factor 1 isoform X1 n=2 Tax=Sphaerodactylus townsendi TaxID=933632 RepID=UPI002026F3F1|nr:fas-binding factor 1 isoform X1 [Sphaerodactylus townsendi]XP_048347063.1 fas-binding factor 1 isoform X1 [Sphaerodactylus townsendi]